MQRGEVLSKREDQDRERGVARQRERALTEWTQKGRLGSWVLDCLTYDSWCFLLRVLLIDAFVWKFKLILFLASEISFCFLLSVLRRVSEWPVSDVCYNGNYCVEATVYPVCFRECESQGRHCRGGLLGEKKTKPGGWGKNNTSIQDLAFWSSETFCSQQWTTFFIFRPIFSVSNGHRRLKEFVFHGMRLGYTIPEFSTLQSFPPICSGLPSRAHPV